MTTYPHNCGFPWKHGPHTYVVMNPDRITMLYRIVCKGYYPLETKDEAKKEEPELDHTA